MPIFPFGVLCSYFNVLFLGNGLPDQNNVINGELSSREEYEENEIPFKARLFSCFNSVNLERPTARA